MGWFSVVGDIPRVVRVMRLCGCGMFEFLEGGLYVRACFVVPFEGEAKVDPNAPVGGDIV